MIKPETQVVGPEPELSDEELIQGCVEGSTDAWDALIHRYQRLIYSIPMRLGYQADDASEIFQEVCLKLLSELPRLRERRTLPAWLIKVTSNECFHWRRRLARKGFSSKNSYDENTLRAHEVPEGMLLELEQDTILLSAMTELDDRCRRLIDMLFFTSPAIPYDEVARSLGIATGSVGFIRMRCLGRLKKQLEKKGFK